MHHCQLTLQQQNLQGALLFPISIKTNFEGTVSLPQSGVHSSVSWVIVHFLMIKCLIQSTSLSKLITSSLNLNSKGWIWFWVLGLTQCVLLLFWSYFLLLCLISFPEPVLWFRLRFNFGAFCLSYCQQKTGRKKVQLFVNTSLDLPSPRKNIPKDSPQRGTQLTLVITKQN